MQSKLDGSPDSKTGIPKAFSEQMGVDGLSTESTALVGVFHGVVRSNKKLSHRVDKMRTELHDMKEELHDMKKELQSVKRKQHRLKSEHHRLYRVLVQGRGSLIRELLSIGKSEPSLIEKASNRHNVPQDTILNEARTAIFALSSHIHTIYLTDAFSSLSDVQDSLKLSQLPNALSLARVVFDELYGVPYERFTEAMAAIPECGPTFTRVIQAYSTTFSIFEKRQNDTDDFKFKPNTEYFRIERARQPEAIYYYKPLVFAYNIVRQAVNHLMEASEADWNMAVAHPNAQRRACLEQACQRWDDFRDDILATTGSGNLRGVDSDVFARRIRAMYRMIRKSAEKSDEAARRSIDSASNSSTENSDDEHGEDGNGGGVNDNNNGHDNEDTFIPFEVRPICKKCLLPPHDPLPCPHSHCKKCREWGHTKDVCQGEWKCTICKLVVSTLTSLQPLETLNVVQGHQKGKCPDRH